MSVIRVALTALLAAGTLNAAGLPAYSADPIVGSWHGVIDQPGDAPYKGFLSFSTPNTGKSFYPSSDCGGKTVGIFRDGTYYFRETITKNRATLATDEGCLDGDFKMTVDGDKMHWEWTGTWLGDVITATGEFIRDR